MTGADNRAAFDPRVMVAVVVVGVIGFIAMWALVALGPQLTAGDNGQGHALSRSAPGYAGIVDLAERSDMWVDVRREVVEAQPLGEDEGRTLLVLTPAHDTDPDDIAELITAHGDEPVLLVLPKWRTGPHPDKKGWSGPGGTVPPPATLIPSATLGGTAAVRDTMLRTPVQAALSGAGTALRQVTLRPGSWHSIATSDAMPMLALPGPDRALLIRSSDRDFYVLADPDLINNFAFASRDGARAALAILDVVAEDADAGGVAFDVTLNGIGGGGAGGFLRLAFVPPFIGITLCLIAAGLLALWQAAIRFGPARRPVRAIPISKLALIESSAELVAQTQRENDAAVPWLRAQRDALARGLHAPPALTGEALDAWIDRRRRDTGGESFAALARRLLLARSSADMLATARELHIIRKELLREH